MENRACIFCQTEFTPNKYSPRQKVCSNPACQKKRQLDSMKEWRTRHPDYFKYDESKGQEWLDLQRKRSKVWRQKNPDKVRSYRQAHSQEYRNYMREYMRRYREKRKSGPENQAPPPEPPTHPQT